MRLTRPMIELSQPSKKLRRPRSVLPSSSVKLKRLNSVYTCSRNKQNLLRTVLSRLKKTGIRLRPRHTLTSNSLERLRDKLKMSNCTKFMTNKWQLIADTMAKGDTIDLITMNKMLSLRVSTSQSNT